MIGNDATYAFWAGTATPSASSPFSVTKAGALTATSATITGVITATSGSFKTAASDTRVEIGVSGVGYIDFHYGANYIGRALAGSTFIGFTTANQIILNTGSSTNLTHNTYTIWDAGNDGSGSSLDADLVKGYNGYATSAWGSTSAATNPTLKRNLTINGITVQVATYD